MSSEGGARAPVTTVAPESIGSKAQNVAPKYARLRRSRSKVSDTGLVFSDPAPTKSKRTFLNFPALLTKHGMCLWLKMLSVAATKFGGYSIIQLPSNILFLRHLCKAVLNKEI